MAPAALVQQRVRGQILRHADCRLQRGVAHREEIRGGEPLDAQVGRVDLAVIDAQIELAVILHVGGGDLDAYMRMLVEEAVQTRHQPLGAEGWRHCHAQRGVGGVHQQVGGLLDRAQGITHAGEVVVAGIRQRELVVAAEEQLFTQMVFELLDLVADRGIGHAQLISGPAEAQVAARDFKDAQCIEGRKAPCHAFSLRKI